MARGVEARRIAYSLATAQAGVLTRRQLLGQGLTSDQIDYWLCSGQIFRFLPGVYCLGRPAESAESRWMAGVLFGGDCSALAGESAAEALGLSQVSNQIDVVRPQGSRRSVRGCAPHDDLQFSLRRGSMQRSDLTRVGPVPVMEPARLLIDLAGKVPERRLRRLFIEAGRMGLLTPQCLARIATRSFGFHGREHLLSLHSNWDPSTGKIRSVLEGEFKLMCAEEGLPVPLTNRPIGRYEVDVLWQEAHLVVELDGRRFHGDLVALVDDSAKTRYLRSMGYKVLRFTWNDVTERPTWVSNQLRKELGSSYPGIARASRTEF